ncbi:MAG: GMC oxidoreductase [Myxococcota bacterium]
MSDRGGIQVSQSGYDIVAVGTGFATSFYLSEFLRWAAPGAKILVLERGPFLTHGERLLRRDGATPMTRGTFPVDPSQEMTNLTPARPWYFGFGHGGGSNCWWGTTPRMMPADFELFSRFGVGADWPIGYDDLEEAYCDVEDAMGVSGSSRFTPFPRSRPYPLPPHRMNDPDYALATRFPDAFFAAPAARPSRAYRGRPACCASHRCNQCPLDAKFTILNGMRNVYEDRRVETAYDSTALAVEIEAGQATGVRFERQGRERVVQGDLVLLGANAIFNPFLLLKSGLDGPQVGRGLVEQVGRAAFVKLRGMSGFQASSTHAGHGYSMHRDELRSRQAACLIETRGAPLLRKERGRWLEHYVMHFIYEDLRQDQNRVTVDKEDPNRPQVEFHGISPYARLGLRRLEEDVAPLMEALPVESVEFETEDSRTQFHIAGTCPMGEDEERGVVDRQLVHHRVRNLVVAGASAFPTCAPANPTLTLSALSVYAARKLFGKETSG